MECQCGCQSVTVFSPDNLQFVRRQEFPKNGIAEGFEEVKLGLVESECLICHS
jgi:predicted transcriptional regulator